MKSCSFYLVTNYSEPKAPYRSSSAFEVMDKNIKVFQNCGFPSWHVPQQTNHYQGLTVHLTRFGG